MPELWDKFLESFWILRRGDKSKTGPSDSEISPPNFYSISRNYDSVITDFEATATKETELLPIENFTVWSSALTRVPVIKKQGRAKLNSTHWRLNWRQTFILFLTVLTMCPADVCSSIFTENFPGKIPSGYHSSKTGDSDKSEFRGEDPNSLVRFYNLYNRCSGGYLQMFYNVINANGKYDSPLVDLRVQPDFYGSQIRIMSHKFGKYLCFNKRKRLTVRYNGRSRRCVFSERISENHFTEFESAWAPGTFLGFNRRGRFLSPDRYFTKRRCFQYMKIQIRDQELADSASQGGNLHSTRRGKGRPASMTLDNFKATLTKSQRSQATRQNAGSTVDGAAKRKQPAFVKEEEETKVLQLFVSPARRQRHRLRHHGKRRQKLPR